MKKLNILLPVIVIVMLVLLSFFYYYKNKNEEVNKVKISTSIGSLAAITREIADNKVDIIDFSEGANHIHELILTPQKIRKAKESKIIFAIGLNLDNWVNKIGEEYKIPIYKFEKDVYLLKLDKKNYNPHYWLSFKNSRIIASKIVDKLIELDPKDKYFYQKKLQNFVEKLNELEKSSQKFKSLKNKKIIITHPAFDYLAQELGLEIIGYLKTEEGEGISPNKLLDLALKIKQNNIKTIFVEKGMIDQTVIQFAKIYNLKMVELDPLEISSQNQLFTETLKENIEKIYNNLSL